MNAIDTNIFLYSVDDDEPTKQLRALALIERMESSSTPVVMLWQVAAEYLAGLRRWVRSGKLQPDLVETKLEELLALYDLVVPTRDVLGISLSLSGKYMLSHWDSMLLAACIDAGVSTLYSEDLADGMVYESVRVVNPL